MTLTIPTLDDRHFQDIVDEAKKRIPHYCKEWTDHNVSDPGVTIIELFAWMTDMILYRLNQVPDLHYVRFMEMLGITLREPVPAKVPITFWLSSAQTKTVTIPACTEVASTQTETEPSIIFTTDVDFRVLPPQLTTVRSRVTSQDSKKKRFKKHNLRQLETGFNGVDLFTGQPQVDDALYFGFENDMSNHVIHFEMEWDPAGGAGVNPSLPPIIWEASSGEAENRWTACEVEFDTTKGMNSSGQIQLHLPGMRTYKLGSEELFWVRVRVKEISPVEAQRGMLPYEKTPRLQQLSVNSLGGTTPATHARQISREFLGQSDGSPGQRFYLQQTPILKRKDGETLSIQAEGEAPESWREVADFASSGMGDRHFSLDSVTGELRLGPAVRQPDGTIKLYGAIPRRGANLLFERYHYGGGQEGNLEIGVLDTLKTAIPYISQVANREPAWGGLDAETLDAAKMRVPAMLRSRDRAVTETDFEFLAHQALPAAIGKVKCLQPRPSDAEQAAPGQVYVLVVPRVSHPDGYLESGQLELKDEDIVALGAYLDERRLLTTRLHIQSPAYHWVSVKVQLSCAPGVEQEDVQKDVQARLYRFLNPLTGGPDSDGWPFGRQLFVSDVYQCLQGIPNVQFIREVELFAAKPNGETQGEPVKSIEVIAHGVVASANHEVVFV